MSIEHCRKRMRVPRISVRERKQRAIFVNEDKALFIITRVDGCVTHNETAADWVVSKENVGDVVIELKGRDVDHAVQQVRATADFWRDQGLRIGQIAGLIVARQYPRSSTRVQRAQQAFARSFRGALHVATSNSEFQIERVLEFDGPH